MTDALVSWPAVRRAVAERCSRRDAPHGWNPFGVPAGLVEWVELLDELGLGAGPRDHDDQAVATAMARVAQDMRLVEATGRWTITRAPRRAPSSYVPGDALALRSLYAMDLMVEADPIEVAVAGNSGIRFRSDAVPVATALAEAEAYWLPPGSEEAVLASEPPPADQLAAAHLRRPISVVWLAHPARSGVVCQLSLEEACHQLGAGHAELGGAVVEHLALLLAQEEHACGHTAAYVAAARAGTWW